jgi:hypothetical protein
MMGSGSASRGRQRAVVGSRFSLGAQRKPAAHVIAERLPRCAAGTRSRGTHRARPPQHGGKLNGGSRGPGSQVWLHAEVFIPRARVEARDAELVRRAGGLHEHRPATPPSGRSARGSAPRPSPEGPARRRQVVVRRPNELVGHAVPAVAHRQHPPLRHRHARRGHAPRARALARRQARRVEHVGPVCGQRSGGGGGGKPPSPQLGGTAHAPVGRCCRLRVVAGRAELVGRAHVPREDLRLRGHHRHAARDTRAHQAAEGRAAPRDVVVRRADVRLGHAEAPRGTPPASPAATRARAPRACSASPRTRRPGCALGSSRGGPV